MLVWSWPPYRFLVPIMPYLIAYMLLAGATILRVPLEKRGGRLALAAGIGAIVVANGALLARYARQARDTGYPQARLSGTPVSWSAYERTFGWLRQNSRPQDVVAAGLDSMVALYTDRRAFRPFVYDPGRLFYGDNQAVLQTPQEFAANLQRYRPRYLVQSPMPGFMEEQPLVKLLDEVRQLYPGWLVNAYQDPDPRFTVFELDSKCEPEKSVVNRDNTSAPVPVARTADTDGLE